MMDDNLDNPQRCDLPDGSVVSCEIVITSYFNHEYKMMYATRVNGDPNLAQAIGLCELAKTAIYEQYMKSEEDESDDEDDDDDDGEDDES